MSSCLVGIPLHAEEFVAYTHDTHILQPHHWDRWMQKLPVAIQEPQELNLKGSAGASFCFNSHYSKPEHQFPVSPFNRVYKTQSWCHNMALSVSNSISHSKVLPEGLFLICGDWAWNGIPPFLTGGPCTLGHLTTRTPDRAQLLKWQNLANQAGSIYKIPDDCENSVTNWPHSKRVIMSIFMPWVAAGKALGELEQFSCWLGKSSQATSCVLSQLLAEEEKTKQVTLQNRAAVDFLLLTHGHGCNEFEGLCCIDFLSKSKSIHAEIKEIRAQVDNPRAEGSDCFKNIFSASSLSSSTGSFSSWIPSIIKDIVWVLFIVLLILLALPILKYLVLKSLKPSPSFQGNKEGEDVGVTLAV